VPSDQVGERLRAIRRRAGLSLHDIEARTSHEFKSSVLGSYERGDRELSVSRLMRLAEVYGVPADELLPQTAHNVVDVDLTDPDSVRDVTIDLVRLHEIDDADAAVIDRYAATIQLMREDFHGEQLRIRGQDLRVLAAVMGRSLNDLDERLDQLGLAIRQAK
jgi:transcriptional regulator with XRE-family HTH domain